MAIASSQILQVIYLIAYLLFFGYILRSRQIRLNTNNSNNNGNSNDNDLFVVLIDQTNIINSQSDQSHLNQFSSDINSNSNQDQLNQNSIQSDEPPLYDMVTNELPSYEEAVKQESLLK